MNLRILSIVSSSCCVPVMCFNYLNYVADWSDLHSIVLKYQNGNVCGLRNFRCYATNILMHMLAMLSIEGLSCMREGFRDKYAVITLASIGYLEK